MQRLTIEQWVAAPGLEGTHEVNARGDVRSVGRAVRFVSKRGRECWRPIPSKLLRPSDNGRGYLYISQREDGKTKHYYVHRLVCEAFHGRPPFEAAEVNHKDGDKANNAASNLEWVDRLENCRHTFAELGPSQAKLTPDDVLDIRWLRGMGARTSDIAESFDVSLSTIKYVVSSKSWSYV